MQQCGAARKGVSGMYWDGRYASRGEARTTTTSTSHGARCDGEVLWKRYHLRRVRELQERAGRASAARRAAAPHRVSVQQRPNCFRV